MAFLWLRLSGSRLITDSYGFCWCSVSGLSAGQTPPEPGAGAGRPVKDRPRFTTVTYRGVRLCRARVTTTAGESAIREGGLSLSGRAPRVDRARLTRLPSRFRADKHATL